MKPVPDERFDFEKGVYSAKVSKVDLAKFQKITVLQVLDEKGNVAMTFKRGES